MKQYIYHQNNTGGTFDEDMPLKFSIWADTEEDADKLAGNMGAYFDGVGRGMDCECCGDRWNRGYTNDK